ncbi:MAG: acyltransferase [Methyloversatilis sp.]|nr:acyltransferase [Methyloversatilis sp.]
MHAFDLLRGCCAIAVACYHLLTWQHVVTLDAIGLYAVYVFFVLSGASITLAYADKLRTLADFRSFMAIRYLRLAPLYMAVLALAMAYRVVARDNDALLHKALQLLPNITMLFGVGNPGASSLVIGGWSLGIEFLFYLLFPAFLVCASLARGKPWLAAAMLALTLLIQQGFVNSVLQSGMVRFSDHVFAYTQFAAFIAYFSGGCAIGMFLRSRPGRRWSAWAWIPAIALLVLLFADHTSPQASMLTGLEGGGRAMLTVLVVLAWSRLPVGDIMQKFSGSLGDASYGIYLLHPVLFHGFAALGGNGGFLPALSQGANAAVLCVMIVVCSFVLSIAFHRLVEMRVLRWGKERFVFDHAARGHTGVPAAATGRTPEFKTDRHERTP